MLKKAWIFLLITGYIVVSSGCHDYSKILKSPDNTLKYETGVDLYENGDFKKALEFFDMLRTFYQGTEKGEKLTYYTANCYFQMKDYQLASYYFHQYQQMYPKGKHAEESAYLQAYCTYLTSPRPELDQTNTYKALQELQAFINRYPNSPRVGKATQLMDNLHKKLEIKEFKTAYLYYRMESYQAAITSFKNLLNDYPNSDSRELYMYYIAKAYYEYASKSVVEKQKERYEKMVEAYNNLLFLFPKSKYLPELKPLSEKAKLHLK
ncbi:outer membrane protein assembly factor BamD [Candidatus Sulfidibacterium hydrothermale]|uniref:outer membrane protein assembly factor BamD n=1 Tax=Candidatus Sulfidibacterium hydrothermale TaxID=2875962 RepID=UPI001F0ACAFF|nr:outer membrane protein assembly factor BamD [Candidatus Sulfidibacterium hydrothermale]UBM63246.1 outer membrane protein assembly factor BamD [Candidatus Sulfidibacterium hydrothermale]